MSPTRAKPAVKSLEGGCLCGSVRYRFTSALHNAHTCSCRMCQKASGAPIVAWVDVDLADFAWAGPVEPAWHRSSEKTQRGFCPRCGGALCCADDGADQICIAVATLDRPNLAPPAYQSYKSSAARWLPRVPPTEKAPSDG